MENTEFDLLWAEFLDIAHINLSPDNEYVFEDVLDQARWQVSDWYNGASYYGKPEDILEDFFMLTPAQAHKYLVLFRDRS